MKKLLTIISSLLIAVAFSCVALAANLDNPGKTNIQLPTKQKTLKPNEARVNDSKYTNKNTQQNQEDKNKNKTIGRKVETKNESKKN